MVCAAVAGQVFSGEDIAIKQTLSFVWRGAQAQQHRVNKVMKMSLYFFYTQRPRSLLERLLWEGNYATKITLYVLFHITSECWYISPGMMSGMSSKSHKEFLEKMELKDGDLSVSLFLCVSVCVSTRCGFLFTLLLYLKRLLSRNLRSKVPETSLS